MNNQTHPPANVGAPTTMHVDVFRAFVEQAKADPAMLHRLAAVFNYQPPFRRSNPIVPLPIRRMKTIEVAIDDNGPPKPTKRVRPDRQALRFGCTIQVLTPASSQVSKPCWSGRAQFRSVSRLILDAPRLRREKKISQAYLDWLINEVIPMASTHDWMIGCIRIKTEKQGSPYAEQQVICASRVGLESNSLDNAYLITGEKVIAMLPSFVTTTSLGNPLSGSFVLQSRGAHPSDKSKANWKTGDLQVQA